jgi:hypothetical protein
MDNVSGEQNEIGYSPPRGRPRADRASVGRWISSKIGRDIRFGSKVAMTEGPKTCPVCGSSHVTWGCDAERTKEEIHPLVWDEHAWMADSFICDDCHAGWIEPDEPERITWVRPYWLIREDGS